MKKKTGNRISLPICIGIGIAASMVIALLGAMVSAWMIAREHIGEGSIPYAAMLILAVAVAGGAIIAAWLAKEKRLIVCGVVGAGYYLCLIAGTALFFSGQYQGMAISALAVLIGSAIAVLAGMRGKKGTKHKVKISAYR